MPYEFLLKGLSQTQKSIGTDKGLAKIGDAIVNLAYSMAKSIYQSKNSKSGNSLRTGKKVNQTILSNALKDSGLKDFARNRANAHDMADTVEAIVAYVWIKDNISIEEIIEKLTKELSGDLNIRAEENKSGTVAFIKLLESIKEFLPKS